MPKSNESLLLRYIHNHPCPLSGTFLLTPLPTYIALHVHHGKWAGTGAMSAQLLQEPS